MVHQLNSNGLIGLSLRPCEQCCIVFNVAHACTCRLSCPAGQRGRVVTGRRRRAVHMRFDPIYLTKIVNHNYGRAAR